MIINKKNKQNMVFLQKLGRDSAQLRYMITMRACQLQESHSSFGFNFYTVEIWVYKTAKAWLEVASLILSFNIVQLYL